MFWRSHKLDCFRYSFTRYVLGSIFLIGCLLLLTQISDSRKHRGKSTSSVQSHRTLDVSTDHHLSYKNRDGSQDNLLFLSNGQGTEDNSDYINRWYEEDFPDVHETPRVLAIMETFRKKVALTGRKLVNSNQFSYIHNVPKLCVEKKVEIVVGIPSRASNFEARQAIRETWGQYGKDPANNALILFFLGAKKDDDIQAKINAEALKYGDIVQETFVDSYRNLSLKTVALFKWVSTFCLNSTFVLKADDDTYVNMPRLMAKLREQLTRGPMFIMGDVHHNTEPIRDQKNKWYLTREEYPAKTFPNYVSGTAYAMTSTAVMRLYVESLYVKPLLLEDVYITGLVADRATVPRIGEAEFSWLRLDPDGCLFKYKISGHKYSPDVLRKIHHELYNPSLKCY